MACMYQHEDAGVAAADEGQSCYLVPWGISYCLPMGWAQLCNHAMTALLMRPLLMTASYQLHKGVSCSKGGSDAEETCAEPGLSILKVDLVV